MKEVPPRDAIAAFDSASAFLSSLARALEGRDFPYLGQSRFKVPFVYASMVLPTALRRRVYAVASGREGVRPDQLEGIDLERVAAWVTSQYRNQPAAAVLVGSSNGAITHLAAACGVPWLPQTLLVPVRRPRSDPEDLEGASAFGRRHGPSLLARNPGVELHHMHDANQDALSSSEMAYFRIKWRELPTAYRQFLAERLQPGAPIVVVRDLSTWPVTRVGSRHLFQVGAQGGLTPADYLRAPDAPRPDEEAAEAEWGFADALLDPLHDWAGQHGHPVIEIRYRHPQDPAAAVAETFRRALRRRGESAQRLLVSSFVVHDPWRTIATASVPFWTFFPVESAAADLASYLDETAYDEIDIMLFSHGVSSRGLADARTWSELAGRAGRGGRLLGVDASSFPADFGVFARYSRALKGLPASTTAWCQIPVDEAVDGLRAGSRITVHVTEAP